MNPKQEAIAAVLQLTTEFNKAHFLAEQLQWACEMGYPVPERHRALMRDSLATLEKLRRGQDFAQKLELCRASGMTFGPDEQILARQFRGWQKLFAIYSGKDQSNVRYLPHIIAARNKFARAEGSENFYALQVRRNDNLFYWQVFDLLDMLVDKAGTSLRFEYGAEKSVFEILEKHVRLADVFSIWGQTFAGLGITLRGAHVHLDLFSYPHKVTAPTIRTPRLPYEVDEDTRKPAEILLSVCGDVAKTLTDLLFMGGHVAHIANFNAGIPWCCNFAPMSSGIQTWQALLTSSVISDPAWHRMFLTNPVGDTIDNMSSAALTNHSFRQHRNTLLSSLAIAYAERAVYECPESQLTESLILELWQSEVKRLRAPNIAPDDISFLRILRNRNLTATHHGVVLAHMATATTLRYLHTNKLEGFAHFGELMSNACWWKGGLASISSLLLSVTKEHLNAEDLVQQLRASSAQSLVRLHTKPVRPEDTVLDATITLANGPIILASENCVLPGGFAKIDAVWRMFTT